MNTHQLLKAREQRLLGEGEQALSELEVVALVAALDPGSEFSAKVRMLTAAELCFN